MNKQVAVILIFCALLCSGPAVANAAVPSEMTAQGRLTNTAGDPVVAGPKTFTFKIFNAATLGTEIWPNGLGENQTVTTDADGLWTARVGSIVPLTDAVYSGTERWLQVTVYDGVNPPEILSRIKLNTNPYSYRVSTVDSATGGHIKSTTVIPRLELGVATVADGALELYGAGSPDHAVAIENAPAGGGTVTCFDATGTAQAVQLLPDVDGSGGYLAVRRGGALSGVVVDGNAAGSGDPTVLIQGASRSMTFDTRVAGDLSVQLPAGSISATEISNEPGLASSKATGSISLNTSAMTDIATVSITTPDAGYIVVDGKTYVNCSGTTSENFSVIQIDSTTGGSEETPYAVYAGLSAYAGTGNNWFPVCATRVFFVPAGTYTYRIEGMQTNPNADGSVAAWDPLIHAVYYPTAYGTVTALVTASEASQFSSAIPVPTTRSLGSDRRPQSTPLYQVDLRELELKAARLTAEIERARRELLEVQIARQGAAGVPAPQ